MRLRKKRDVIMIEKALSRGWDIPETVRRALPAEVTRFITEKNEDGTHRHSPRTRLAAVRVLTAMEGHNIQLHEGERRDDRPAVSVNVGVGVSVGSEAIGEDRLVEVADDWGVPVDLVRDALAGPDASAAPVIDTTATAGESTTEPV